MEDTLEKQPWLAGREMSLADTSMIPYVNRLDMLGMSDMWILRRPRLTDWFERVKMRPSFKPALIDVCPSDLTQDLITFGSESWQEARRFVAA
jgi:glutathione S-transferase